jgi:hypothetical protein
MQSSGAASAEKTELSFLSTASVDCKPAGAGVFYSVWEDSRLGRNSGEKLIGVLHRDAIKQVSRSDSTSTAASSAVEQ